MIYLLFVNLFQEHDGVERAWTLESDMVWISVTGLLLTSYVIMRKLYKFFEVEFLYHQVGIMITLKVVLITKHLCG